MKREPSRLLGYDLQLLMQLYDEQPLTVDMLPHTDEELNIHADYCLRCTPSKFIPPTLRELYLVLLTLRKMGKLNAKGHKKGPGSNVHSVN